MSTKVPMTVLKGAVAIMVATTTGAVPAAADALAGTWLTPKDSKGIEAHIEVKPCGAKAMCGVIARTYDSDGRLVHTRNLGVRIFWDMVPTSGKTWEGWAYVPKYKKQVHGEIDMKSKRRIEVGGCIGPICKSQEWSRVW